VEAAALQYPSLLSIIQSERVVGRTDSVAFLLWFLKNIFRLPENTSQDAICDSPDDKGIDGIYVDADLDTVFVFQSKILQNTAKTIGDFVNFKEHSANWKRRIV